MNLYILLKCGNIVLRLQYSEVGSYPLKVIFAYVYMGEYNVLKIKVTQVLLYSCKDVGCEQ